MGTPKKAARKDVLTKRVDTHLMRHSRITDLARQDIGAELNWQLLSLAWSARNGARTRECGIHPGGAIETKFSSTVLFVFYLLSELATPRGTGR
jgi:hypothetical protein